MNKKGTMNFGGNIFFSKMIKLLFLGYLSLLLTTTQTMALVPTYQHPFTSRSALHRQHSRPIHGLMASAETTDASSTRAPPRTGFGQTLLNFALESPLWKLIMVPQARATMVKTAEANDIPWTAAKEWIQKQAPVSELEKELQNGKPPAIPAYYEKSFHAYEAGNLNWDAAFEVEIASAAVGARNFPEYGAKGEDAFRGAFESALEEGGANVPTREGNADPVRIVDLGCGTGMSTRRLAKNFPQADSIIGVDLSPYFVSIGKKLLELTPSSFQEGGPWVSNIEADSRIEYFVGDAAKASEIKDVGEMQGTADVVNLQFVLHELPPYAARDIVDEAFRLLKPNGQLWVCEMDFEAPAYAAQRANPLLFSLIRSTEPYLDDYAESITDLFSYIRDKSPHVKVVPATGRHFALVATKGNESESTSSVEYVMQDMRFDDDGNYRVEDTHLPTFFDLESEKK